MVLKRKKRRKRHRTKVSLIRVPPWPRSHLLPVHSKRCYQSLVSVFPELLQRPGKAAFYASRRESSSNSLYISESTVRSATGGPARYFVSILRVKLWLKTAGWIESPFKRHRDPQTPSSSCCSQVDCSCPTKPKESRFFFWWESKTEGGPGRVVWKDNIQKKKSLPRDPCLLSLCR